jgi:hypothetical protein
MEEAVALGPIEIVTLVFPGSQFNGEVIPKLSELVKNGTVTIVDGLFVVVGEGGEVDIVEFSEAGDSTGIAALAELIEEVNGLISEDDVAELTSGLEPGSSAAILVFEHTWVKPLRDALVGSGGYLLDTVRVPGAVVDEVLEAVAGLAD